MTLKEQILEIARTELTPEFVSRFSLPAICNALALKAFLCEWPHKSLNARALRAAMKLMESCSFRGDEPQIYP